MTITENRAAYILYNILKSMQGKGKWIIPSNCCSVIPATFYKSKTLFETCDISKDTYCMDLAKVRDRIRQHPAAYSGVLLIYTYGAELEMREAIKAFKKAYPGILFIEDKCLCKPSFKEDLSSGADVVMFSTGYAKYVDAGFGGYAFLNENVNYIRQSGEYKEADRIDFDLKVNKAIKKERKVSVRELSTDWLSMNADEISPEKYFTLIKGLTVVSESQKAAINAIYQAAFDPEISMPDNYNTWRFNVLVNKPEELLKNIFDSELYASRHYCPVGQYIDTLDEHSPVAKFLYDHVINLFNDRYFSIYKAELTCSIVKKHVARYGCPAR